jgi:hypothetical protein
MPPRLAWFSHLAFADFRRGDAARPRTERPERDSPQPGDRTLPALPAVPAWLVLPADPLVLRLVARLRPDFYAIEEAAREAMRLHRMFNAIHLETGFKVDLVVKKIRSFSTEELRRREPGQLGRPKVDFATAEDTILSKLEWAKLGDSERQYGDAVGILATQSASTATQSASSRSSEQIQRARLDWAYLERWAGELGVLEVLRRAQGGEPFRDDLPLP